jgi:hypothetical protein
MRKARRQKYEPANHLISSQTPAKHVSTALQTFFCGLGHFGGIRKYLSKNREMFENVEQFPAPAKHVIYGLENIYADWAIVWYTKKDLILDKKIAKCSLIPATFCTNV